MVDRDAPVTDDARATIARLADEVLPALIERLTRSELGELEVREAGWRVRLRRPLSNGVSASPRTTSAGAQGASAAHRPIHPPAHGPAREPDRGVVRSPGVGYFTPRAGVETGAKLAGGDLIGHVDVLGVRHEVAVDRAGVLRAFEVEPGQAVEYGQPIARIEVEA